MDKHTNYYSVRWRNFKGFVDTDWIKIKPITILLGENNVGKTNFIAPFLLMHQTLMSRDSNSPLIIKGELYDGGNIKELLNNYDLRKEIYLGFRYHVHESNEKKLPELGIHAPGALEITLSLKDKKKDGEILVKKESVSDVFLREFYTLTLQADNSYKLSGSIPQSSMSAREKLAIANADPINFLFSPSLILSSLNRPQKDDVEKPTIKRKAGYSKAFSSLLDVMSFNYSQIRDHIGDLSYIGPVRERPHRVYEVSNESYNTVGPKGENTANLLKKHLHEIHRELNKWVKRFGFGDKLELEPLYANSYAIHFKRNNEPDMYTNIANSGFGASQILPLIVQALVADKDTLTIAEQPEIHLNPKLQCELADLFAFMANKEQKVIVETHSEYLLLRLRKLVADSTISADNIAIYYITNTGDGSKIKEIPIQSNGHIKDEDWPSDFFEDSLKESMALAAQQFNKAKQKKNATK